MPDADLTCPACGRSLFRAAQPPQGSAAPAPTEQRCARAPTAGPLLGVLLGLAFAAFIIWVFGRVHVLACARVAPDRVDCVAQDQLFGWIPLGAAQQLAWVDHAEPHFEERFGDEGLYTIRFLAIYAESGTHRFEYRRHDVTETAQRINAFIRDSSAPALEIHERSPLIGQLCGGFLVLDVLFFVVLLLRARRNPLLRARPHRAP